MSGTASFVQYTSPIKTLQAVRERVTEAVIGQSGLNHSALAAEIRRRFSSTDIADGALVQEPVLEAAFPYVAGDETLGGLAGRLLHPKVVDALTGDGSARQYAFARDLRPYRHQLEAWRLLNDSEPRSVMITSGTGSGKTECFLVPLLHDLACEVDRTGRLSGVRAIALYPLNALIASQEERLREWTAPFDGRIRFGLYNGNMIEDAQAKDCPPEQVIDRRTLRNDPPPILVTNVTMLEYMTVRKEDRPLIENSRGKLRWIILDEAHSYVGSAAAEIALLIRRVLLAFGVSPSEVRFVATSATIGEGEVVALKLKRFLSDVAGIQEARVHVVVGNRRTPSLPKATTEARLSRGDLDSGTALASNPVVHELVRQLGEAPMTWPAFSRLAARTGVDAEEVARALATTSVGGEPILPLRVHGFMRAVPGLWTCLNPRCSGKPKGEWPFGSILPERIDTCPHCSGAVLEIVNCSACGEPFLDAVERNGQLRQTVRLGEADEFAAASDDEAIADDDAEAITDEPPPQRPDINWLIAVRSHPKGRPLHVAPSTGMVCDAPTDATCKVLAHDREYPECCPACNATARAEDSEGAILRPFRYGAPFLIGNAAPLLLEGVPPRAPNPQLAAPPPSEGRQLLSFTDSRQGTARFAAALQSAAERNYVRAVIYHAVQDSQRPEPVPAERIASLDNEIAALESVAHTHPSLGDMLAAKKAERASFGMPKSDGLSWSTMRERLAAQPEIEHWMRPVWGQRDERFQASSRDFAEFLMLREFARRPRRANSLETLGLARLRFPDIEKLGEQRLPRAFRERGRTLTEWREFLYLLLTIRIRNTFAIRMERENVHWLIRNGFPRVLLSPDSQKNYASELVWPSARPKGRISIAVRLLERVLGLDSTDPENRSAINDTFRSAWESLFPLFTQPGAGGLYALDLEKAYISPVRKAYLCPVTRRLLDTTFAGISPYGLDGSSRLAGQACAEVEMPTHPNPFLLPEHGGAAAVQEWLATDPTIAKLRARALWGDLHNRIALGSPYTRAAEHSAQQPPSRLRRYEAEFKAGQINILNCSTTMEMGVDIGSVSSVMMTNVPPSIANYRQRVGRAGRRGQGFAMSLTYARDMPLDRETFRLPVTYLTRKIEAPKVTLDSRRIVQRHVNALLLSEWFTHAGGEALKAKAGDFFGCSPIIGAQRASEVPVVDFKEWVTQPSTAANMEAAVRTLVRGSALAADQGVYEAAKEAIEAAERAFVTEWEAIQVQAIGMDRDSARKSLGFQLKRMCDEYLLGELADRGVLPGHGFPTAVVPFVNKDRPDKDEVTAEAEGSRFRRRNYPTRNLDVAIRDYAPGAEVVVDGLVYRSAGVTLNWKRPAGESAVGEIQSLKWFWECNNCGAADTARLRPDRCLACGAGIEAIESKRFLEPAGFTVDMLEKPHAEIERVSYVEPEPERVAARGAVWKPFLEPTRGRLRASRDGLVFYASSGGAGSHGYSVCLECGRAEAEHQSTSGAGKRPLADHKPLRFTKANSDGRCPGNGRGFVIQTGLALGHDITTDVAEVQPRALTDQNAAWALASALREALARRLGIEAGELGLSVAARDTPVGGRTHSLFLFDRAAGGAGFSPRLIDLFEELLRDAREILDCKQEGCQGGCSACIVTGDLYAQAETIDRRAALAFVDTELAAIAAPAPIDAASPGAVLARDVADDLAAIAEGRSDAVILWPASPFDSVSLMQPRMRALLHLLTRAGHEVTLCLPPEVIASLDAAQRLSLRDSTVRHGLRLGIGMPPQFPHGSRAIAALGSGRIWASRDAFAGQIGDNWGIGIDAPVVRFEGMPPTTDALDRDSLLPKSGTRFLEVHSELDGASRNFGQRFTDYIEPVLKGAGLWLPGRLTAVEYMDRYVRSPLTASLVVGAVSQLKAALAPQGQMPFRLSTADLKVSDGRTPYRLSHDWQIEDDRAAVLELLSAEAGLRLEMVVGKGLHSRRLKLVYDITEATIVLDQGFGFLKPTHSPTFNFDDAPSLQAKRLASVNVLCAAEGATYFVIVDRRSSE